MTTPSTTTFIVADSDASATRNRARPNPDANRHWCDLARSAADEALTATLDGWEREAAEIRRYARTVAPFVPHADAPTVRPFTAAETAEMYRALGVETVTPQRDSAECPNSSYRDKRNRATRTLCRRAIRRWVADAATGTPTGVFLACESRTCRDCRQHLDETDAARIADGLGQRAYLAEIPADDWPTISRRLRRHGAIGARVPSTRDPSRIVVIATEPPTPDAVRVADIPTVALDLMLTRPTGQTRRLTTFGGVASRAEWEGRVRADALDGPSESMAPTVQPADIERVADALGLPHRTIETRYGVTVRLDCRWDDYRAVALRRWSRNPTGESWEARRIETLIAEGVYSESPPDSAYREIAV